MHNIIIYITLLLFLNTDCIAGTISPEVEDSKYIEYGQKHKCVLQLKLSEKIDDQWITAHGSCTVINPKVIITAAHVIKNIDKAVVITSDGSEVRIKYSIFPALFKTSKLTERYDIAVCLLDKEIKLDYYPELYRDKDERNKICSIAGFGVTGNHDTGVTDRNLTKRAGSNIVDEIINEMLVCTVGQSNRTELEYMIAPGDSGGGLFIDKKLAGVNSNVATIYKDKKSNSDKNDFGCHTRVSNHVVWIDKCIELFEKLEEQEEQGENFEQFF